MIYAKQEKRKEELIKKLFEIIAKETIGIDPIIRIKFRIEESNEYGCSYCGAETDNRGNYILIVINLENVQRKTIEGYSNDYYMGRQSRLNKYIIKNRHNSLRFVMYHEARHAYQRINKVNRDNEYTREFDADGWAIKHLKGVK